MNVPRLINARSHAVVDLALAARALAEATLIINNNDNSSSRSKNNNSMHSPLLDGNILHAAAPPRPSPPPLPLHLAAAPRVGWGRVVGHRGMGRDGIPPTHTHRPIRNHVGSSPDVTRELSVDCARQTFWLCCRSCWRKFAHGGGGDLCLIFVHVL